MNALALVPLETPVASTGPDASHFEPVICYLCDSAGAAPLLSAADDLTGKPRRFHFVVCERCRFHYQNPWLTVDSVYQSPECKRVTTGEIGYFNRGSFHLATSLRAPIVPSYLATPRDIEPGMGYDTKAGVVDVYILPAIDASGWQLIDLGRTRNAVHNLYVRVHEAVRTTGLPSAGLSVVEPFAPQEKVAV